MNDAFDFIAAAEQSADECRQCRERLPKETTVALVAEWRKCEIVRTVNAVRRILVVSVIATFLSFGGLWFRNWQLERGVAALMSERDELKTEITRAKTEITRAKLALNAFDQHFYGLRLQEDATTILITAPANTTKEVITNDNRPGLLITK